MIKRGKGIRLVVGLIAHDLHNVHAKLFTFEAEQVTTSAVTYARQETFVDCCS